jgi:hypothetical protein
LLSHLRSYECYDEPETLPYSIHPVCPMSADGGQVVAWPEQALNPMVGKTFKGLERTHCDRVLTLAMQQGAPIARKHGKDGACGEYVIDPAEYDQVKTALARIVRSGLLISDFVHARPLLQELIREATAG